MVRWVVREKGVTLAGPAPSALIEPVSSKDLASELYDMLRLINVYWSTAEAIGQRGIQAFFVTLCCRALHTGGTQLNGNGSILAITTQTRSSAKLWWR